MFGQALANPSIDEMAPQGSATPQHPPQSATVPADLRDTLAEPAGMLSDDRNRRRLPALVPPAATPASRRARAASALPIGILLYLVSVGIIATATIGVFFGIGFFLLVQPTEAMIPSAGTRDAGPDIKPLLYSMVPRFFSNAPPADGKVASVPIETEIPRAAAVAILPAAPPTQRSAADQTAPPEEGEAAPPSPVGDAPASAAKNSATREEVPELAAREASPTAPAAVPEPAPSSPAVAAVAAPTGLRLPGAEIAELLARGDTFLRMGDVTSARLFYERAADAGDGQAAMRMGATFDPTFLGRAGLRGTRGDPAAANSWYRHALELSAAESLETK